MQLIDRYQRRFKYLRLSLTENCNFQCQYCLPNGYSADRKKSDFISITEIEHLVNAFSELGVSKIRLTGGEPTLRRDFTDIVRLLADNAAIDTVALTTNGVRLVDYAAEWKNAGLNAVNISVDSLSPFVFKLITGQDKLNLVLNAVERSLDVGIEKIKVNTVLMKGLNDTLNEYLDWIKIRPLELRFIELMETGEHNSVFHQYHISGQIIENQLIRQGWQLLEKDPSAGPAKVYKHSDYLGKIGLIMPYSPEFCSGCNRLRVSSTGKFHFCLFGDEAIDLRDLLQDSKQKESLQKRIIDTLIYKPKTHFLHDHNSGIIQTLSCIGG